MAEAILQGLDMPVTERRERWHAKMTTLRRNDANAWRRHFIEALAAVEATV
jgi:trehalose-6-phosphate synthase